MGFFSSIFLFICFIFLRLLNAATTFTFAQPDEYWQALEPAHMAVYKFGYLTWEWRVGLRSSAHPLLFSFFYRLLDGPYAPDFAKASPDAIVWVPGLVQAIIAALADFHFVIFAHTMFTKKYPKGQVTFYSSIITIGSAYNWYMSTRTFSNSLEMALTTIALTYWPWRPHKISSPRYILSLVVAGASCAFRPTNALIWIFLGSILVFKTNRKSFVISCAFIIVSTVFVGSAVLDNWYYTSQDPDLKNLDTFTIMNKKFVFPLWNFVKFNFLENVAPFYGSSPWYYYPVLGIPILLIGFLPFTLYDMFRSKSSHSTLLILFVVAVFSVLEHKEIRFIYPIIPILHLKTLNSFLRNHAGKKLSIFIVMLNLCVGVFFNTFHQRGVIDVMTYLRHNGYYSGSIFVSQDDTPQPPVTSVGFLMPCHSTPWQSHLHRRDLASWSDFWFLTCEPPIGLTEQDRKQYLSVTDQFYVDPEKFLSEKFPPLSTIKKADSQPSQFSKRSEFVEEPVVLAEAAAQEVQIPSGGQVENNVFDVVQDFKQVIDVPIDLVNEKVMRNDPDIQHNVEADHTKTEAIAVKVFGESTPLAEMKEAGSAQENILEPVRNNEAVEPQVAESVVNVETLHSGEQNVVDDEINVGESFVEKVAEPASEQILAVQQNQENDKDILTETPADANSNSIVEEQVLQIQEPVEIPGATQTVLPDQPLKKQVQFPGETPVIEIETSIQSTVVIDSSTQFSVQNPIGGDEVIESALSESISSTTSFQVVKTTHSPEAVIDQNQAVVKNEVSQQISGNVQTTAPTEIRDFGSFNHGSYEYKWPSHLVFFQSLEDTIVPLLKDTEYRECKRFFNSFFHEDPQRQGDVIVYCK